MIRKSLLPLLLAACGGAQTEAPPPAPPATQPVASEPALPPEAPPTAAAPTAPKLRLPPGVKPTRGQVALRVVPGENTFSGTVDFQLTLDAPTQVIWMHQHELAFLEAGAIFEGKAVPAAQTSVQGDFVGVVLPRAIGPGPARVHVGFTGTVSEAAIVGLFHVKDGDRDFVVSKFESIFARRAFPCFDEPGFKIPWKLILHVRRTDAAFSNTPEESTTDEERGMKRVVFEDTPPLPSYLVALAVGPWERVDAGRAGKAQVPVGVIVPAGQAPKTAWPTEITAQIVDRLEKYFDVPFPYPKLDLLIVPDYPGGMENAGLILLGSRGMLADRGRMSLGEKRGAGHILMHEIAHMWFGDLVTTAWWDDIWLNEAFASWADHKLVDEWQPSWRAVESTVAARGQAFASDSLLAARKIRQPIESPDDIIGSFDAITYEKGASVLAMVERWVGPEAFRKGVHDFLTAHEYKSATMADFTAALSGAAGRDVGPVLSAFTDQAGLPELSVALRCDKGKAPSLVFEQRRFRPVGTNGGGEAAWKLPVCYKVPDKKGVGVATCFLMEVPTVEMPLEDPACPAWVLANAEEAGYYLSSYQDDLLGRLVAKRAALSLREKLGLVSEVRHLLRTGRMPAPEGMKALALFAADADATVARAALEALQHVDGLIDEATRPAWRRWLVKTLGARAKAVGWKSKKGDTEAMRLLRPKLLEVVALVGREPALLTEGAALGRRWLDDRNAVEPEVRGVALMAAAVGGDAMMWERVHREQQKERDPEARLMLLRALVSFEDGPQLQKGLDHILGAEVNARETYSASWGIALWHPRGRSLRLDFADKRWDDLIARFPPNRAGDLLAGLVQCEPEPRQRLADSFGDRAAKLVGGARALAQALEASDMCIEAREAQAEGMKSFLR